MQLTSIRREVASHGIQQSARATIAASSQVFNLFENHYSDRFKAIVRELTANAIDAQGSDTNPVHVYLPDAFDPYFRVKDHGIGMAHEFCMTKFMEYSNGSTKSGSNEAIGGFGIGSKSPFAYVDQYTMRSVHNGTCSVYSLYKDEDGFPCIALLDQTPTDEVNGVEFSVPVEPDDYSRFTMAATNHLVYFGDRVKLHGGVIKTVDYTSQGPCWGIRPRSSLPSGAQVIMGGMAYPINQYALERPWSHDPLMGIQIDLIMPIGSCSIAPSREALLYDDKTTQSIHDAIDDIRDEVTANMPTMFDHLTSKWDVCVALDEYLGTDKNNPWARLVREHVRWQGKEIEIFLDVQAESLWHIEARSRRRRRTFSPSKCPSSNWVFTSEKVQPSKITTIIIDDLPSHKGPVQRIRAYVDDNLTDDQEVLVVRGNFDLHEPPVDMFIRTSELPEIPRATRSSSHTSSPRPRVRMFQLMDNSPSQTVPVRERYEVSYADQPNWGILIVMDNFTLPPGVRDKLWLVPYNEVHLVNKSDAPKLGKNWRSFDEVFDERLANELLQYPTLPQWKALQASPLQDLLKFIHNEPKLMEHVTPTSPLGRLVDLYNKYYCAPPYQLHTYVEAKLPPRLDPQALLDRVDTHHWKFQLLREELRYPDLRVGTKLHMLFKELI